MDKLKSRIDQKDLRRMMAERRQNQTKANTEKINSPLAKYDSQGNLSCVLCRTNIKSATIWKVHINSKQHKQNIAEAKRLKDEILKKSPKDVKTQNKKNIYETIKVTTPPVSNAATNVTTQNNSKPLPVKSSISNPHKLEIEKDSSKENKINENGLPEQFFDEPPNKKTKDPQDEEWERFQREIKEETVVSNMIIAGEQTEATVDRQIIEIDEQIQHWSKVLDLEVKLESLNRQNKIKQQQNQLHDNNTNDSDTSESEHSLDDLLNWRCKSFKK